MTDRAMARRNRDRILLLEKYLEQREDLQEAIYRLIESAVQLRLDHGEIEKVTALIKPLQHGCYSIESELSKLKGKSR